MVDLMKNHCTSLEVSKLIKEAGWQKETEFWWVYNKLRDENKLDYGLAQCIKIHPESWEHFPAPLATEILEELPVGIKIENYKSINGNKVFVTNENIKDGSYWGTLPDALARLWIWLKKEGKI